MMDLRNPIEEVTMFDNNCQVCATRVLIFESQVSSVANTAAGIEVRFTCWCGTEQTQVTGRVVRRERVAA
jgi:hypothetical protein